MSIIPGLLDHSRNASMTGVPFLNNSMISGAFYNQSMNRFDNTGGLNFSNPIEEGEGIIVNNYRDTAN